MKGKGRGLFVAEVLGRMDACYCSVCAVMKRVDGDRERNRASRAKKRAGRAINFAIRLHSIANRLTD